MIQSIKNSVHRRLPDPWYTLLYVHRHYSDDPLHTLAFLFKGRGYPLTFGQRFFFAPPHVRHLVCHGCGAVESLADHFLDELSARLLHEYNFKTELNHLVITGLCSQCVIEN